jgi:flagellar biosynthesis/type III secretory pathway protein FliH
VSEERARRALFTDVTPVRPRKKPRWLSPRESTLPPPAAPPPTHAPPAVHLPLGPAPSLRPAPVPKEFVQAVKRELRVGPAPQHERLREIAAHEVLREQMARSLRPSEAPSSAGHEVPKPPAPVIDPALERAFRGAIEEMAVARARILEQAAGQLAALAAVIARRVIARELAIAPEILGDLVREALDALSDEDKVRVRVGRGFQAAVDGLEQELARRGAKFQIVVESSLGDYDCVVETELGQVDESVERRLEKLLEALKPDSEAP